MDDDIQWIREEPNKSNAASDNAVQFIVIPMTKTDPERLKDCKDTESQEGSNGITVDAPIQLTNSISFPEVVELAEVVSPNQETVEASAMARKVPEITLTIDERSSEAPIVPDIPQAKEAEEVAPEETPVSGKPRNDAAVDDIPKRNDEAADGITVDPVIPTSNHITFNEVSEEKPNAVDISSHEAPTDGVKNEGGKREKQEEGADKEEEIQWIRDEADEKTLDISEIEKELERNTREARALVEELGRKAERTDTINKRIHEELDAQRALLTGIGLHKTIEDEVQLPQYSQLPSGGLPYNVESVLIADGMMDINAAIILPNGLVLITNATSINLFNIQGQVVKKVEEAAWKHPRSPVYHKEHILLLVDYDVGGGHFQRFIFKFTLDLAFVARIEGPKWLDDKHVLKDKIAIAHTDFLYLVACGQMSSAIYELSPVGQWSELDYKQSESYVDIVAFATIGPITQLLVVEARRNYVLQLSVRESAIVDRRKIAICQRPGAIAKDDAGRLFVANYATASIQLVDTVRWISQRNVAVAESPIQFFSACWGLVAMPVKGAIRILKYSFR